MRVLVRGIAVVALAVSLVACGGDGGGGAPPSLPTAHVYLLSSYDPLTAATLDSARWQTPEYVRTIVSGHAELAVRASGMQSNALNGLSYTSAVTAAPAGGGRVTTFQADVSVPAAGVSRSGAAFVFGGLRLYYQPSAWRGRAYPGALQNELIAALELVESGSGLGVRRRFGHCVDAACISVSGSSITATDPGGFTVSGTGGHSATAAAAYDTTYTLTLALDEGTGIFTWTVAGGAYGAGVSGTANVSTWASSVGMTLASTTNGFLSAQLHARTNDTNGGGSGAITATFDNVMIGTDGAAATLHDDFATQGSSAATGFSPARWTATGDAAVRPGASGVLLRSADTSPGYGVLGTDTALAMMYPVAPSVIRANVAIVADQGGLPGVNRALVGGAFANDGGGGTNDGTSDLLTLLSLGTGSATASITRCGNATCSTGTVIATQALAPAPGYPLGLGTVHSVLVAWDAVRREFVYQLDGAQTVIAPTYLGTVAEARVPSRFVRAVASSAGTPAGTVSSVEVQVSGVATAP